METKGLSICFYTSKISECKDFYVNNLNAVVSFDHDWYLVMDIDIKKHYSLCFMKPQNVDEPLFGGVGVTLNFLVDNVDDIYKELIETKKLKLLRELASNPWGDRSFVISDPLGNNLYIYSEISASDEYKASFK